mgnify:CR=1 FL=1
MIPIKPVDRNWLIKAIQDNRNEVSKLPIWIKRQLIIPESFEKDNNNAGQENQY